MSHTKINLAIQNIRVQLTDQQQKATMALRASHSAPPTVYTCAHNTTSHPPSLFLHQEPKTLPQWVANSVRYDTAPTAIAILHRHSHPPSSFLHHRPTTMPQSVANSDMPPTLLPQPLIDITISTSSMTISTDILHLYFSISQSCLNWSQIRSAMPTTLLPQPSSHRYYFHSGRPPDDSIIRTS